MTKKIIISESQYRRVFLSEQGIVPPDGYELYNPILDKEFGSDYLLGKKYSSPANTQSQLPIEDLFDYHIKTKENGDHFREWVRSDNKRLSKVEKAIENEGWPGTLDKTGDHKNKYIRLAWKLVGQEYLNTDKGKKDDFFVSEDSIDWEIEEIKNYHWVPDESKGGEMEPVEVVTKYWYPKFNSKYKYKGRSGWSVNNWIKYSGLDSEDFYPSLIKSFEKAPEKSGYKKMYWATTQTGTITFSTFNNTLKKLKAEGYFDQTLTMAEIEKEMMSDPFLQTIVANSIVEYDYPYPLIEKNITLGPFSPPEPNKGSAVFWSYAPIEFYEQEMGIEKETKELEKELEKEEKKEFEKEAIQKSVEGDNKEIDYMMSSGLVDSEIYLPFNSINGFNSSVDIYPSLIVGASEEEIRRKEKSVGTIDLNDYIVNYNECLTHWLTVKDTFGWNGAKIINMDKNFIDTYKFEDVYDSNKDVYNFGTFEKYLDDHPTDIFNPKNLIKIIVDVREKLQKYDPNTILFRMWVIKKLEELGCLSNNFPYKLSGNFTENDLQEVLYWVTKESRYEGSNIPLQSCPSDSLDIIKQFYKDNQSDAEKSLNGLLQLLEFTDQWNKRFLSQKIEYWKDACDNDKSSWVNAGGSTTATRAITSLGGPKKFIGQKWSSFCKSKGGKGNWLYYPPVPVDELGNKDYLIGCGCVNMEHKNDPTSKLTDGELKFLEILGAELGETSAEEGIKNVESIDVRSLTDKFKIWAKNCKSDWHCMIDIASIAVTLVGCVFSSGAGCLLSGAVLSRSLDTISGIGYVYEGLTDPDNPNNQGWKLNAGFSFLPIFFHGMGKSVKFLKGVAKSGDFKLFVNIIKSAESKYGAAVWNTMNDTQKMAAVSQSFVDSFKHLSPAQINKMIRMYSETLHILKSAEYQKLIAALDDVPYSKIGELDELLKLATKSSDVTNDIVKLLNEGKTFNQIIDIYKITPILDLSKSAIKDFLFQTSLFALTQFYPEESAKVILAGIQEFQDVTGVPIKQWLGVSTDVNPNDPMSLAIQKGMGYFATWSTVTTEISNYLKNRISPLLLKYDIDVSKGNIEDFIINGENSLFGEPLNDFKARLELIVKNTEEKEQEKLGFDEIKSFLQEMYDREIEYLEEYTKQDNVIKQIKKESEANPPNEETQKFIKDNNIDMNQFNFDWE